MYINIFYKVSLQVQHYCIFMVIYSVHFVVLGLLLIKCIPSLIRLHLKLYNVGIICNGVNIGLETEVR